MPVTPPGRIIQGRHARLAGAAPPAVVLEAGIAASSASWTGVQAALAPEIGSISYDRPGYGFSAPESGPISLTSLVDELRALALAAPVRRPHVIVAHSFGTYIARGYAHRFPEDVAGLVLIDPVTDHEWIGRDWRRRVRLRRAVCFAQLARGLAAVGVVRLGLWGLLRRGGGNAGPLLGLSPTMRRIAGEVGKLPPEIVAALRTQWSSARFFRTMIGYIRALPACAEAVARSPIPAGVRVTVLSGAHQPPAVLAAHHTLATRHVVVGQGHWIHLDHPQIVTAEIRALMPARESV